MSTTPTPTTAMMTDPFSDDAETGRALVDLLLGPSDHLAGLGKVTVLSTPGMSALRGGGASAGTGSSSCGAYAYQARTLQQPTPQQVRAARLLMGQTQAAAAALVHKSDSARWREWERELDHAGRVIDLAIWELYLIKSGLRVNP